MKIAAKTDIGRVRDSNQDAYATGELPEGVAWAVVCDGMGGVAGGNIAATTAVKVISERFTSAYRASMHGRSIKNLLVSAINAANVSVYDIAQANPAFSGMGTTVVCAIVTDHVAYIAHVGDSRAYMLSGDALLQLTRDHSVVQDMVETGKITQLEAKLHPQKNIITRALGVRAEVRVDFFEQPMQNDDILLLCTDGLSNYVESDEICALSNGTYYEFAERLVSRALQNGGGDNVTAVTLAY